MKCNEEFKDVTYGGGLFCKICGMDIKLTHTRLKHKGISQLYCCADCAKKTKTDINLEDNI